MVNRTADTKSKPTLDGMVFCANCGSEMNNSGLQYICPNSAASAGGKCAARPVAVQYLLNGVVTQMVYRLTTDETVQEVADTIMDITDANARIQRQRMEQAEASIAEANARRTAALQPVEHGAKTHEDAAEAMSKLEQVTAGLAYESLVARNELDKIDFIRDEEGIRETARNPETYLGGNNDEETQELLQLLVRKVVVGAGAAKIIYEVGMPSGEHPEGVHEDLLELDPTIIT
jgi:hypothetical protein